jgi:hypothetical protein
MGRVPVKLKACSATGLASGWRGKSRARAGILPPGSNEKGEKMAHDSNPLQRVKALFIINK